MRVGYDDDIFIRQSVGGISRYFAELIRAFIDDPTLEVEPVAQFRFADNRHLNEVFPSNPLPLPPIARRRVVYAVANSVARPGTHVDVAHRTFYRRRPHRTPRLPQVYTVHDMVPELFPDLFPEGNPHAGKARALADCDAVICVSHSTRRDMEAILGSPVASVHVIPLGVAPRFFAAGSPPRMTTARPVVLVVGDRAAYKNFDVVLRALTLCDDEIRVRCVGGGDFSVRERARIGELGLTDRVTQTSASDSDLVDLYATATALAFPSRYEGFGLPLVEAMAAGCPVIAADSPAAREVAGEAAAFFHPDDEGALGALFARAAGDSEWRIDRSTAGRLRATDFTWARTASATAQVYRDLTT